MRAKTTGITTMGLVALTLGVGAPASALVVPSTAGGAIDIQGGEADPFPSSVTVPELTGTVLSIEVVIEGLSHEEVSQLHLLVESPSGDTALLSGGCGLGEVTDVDLRFVDDPAGADVPDALVSGTYRPTDCAGGTSPFTGLATPGALDDLEDGVAADLDGEWDLYVLDDDDEGETGSIEGWSVEITTNRPPTATPATFIGSRDTVLADTLTGADPDGDTPLSFVVVTPATNGTAFVTDPATGAFTYTPNAGFVGTDTFTFQVEDGFTNSTPAAVTIDILPPNSPPVAVDDAALVPVGRTTIVNVLANDTDPDGDVLTVTIVEAPVHGTATVVANRIHYAPARGFEGLDALVYAVSDGRGGTDTATLTLTVNDLDCIDFVSQEDAQIVLDRDRTDPHDLDRDGDGIACEEGTGIPRGTGTSGGGLARTGTQSSRLADIAFLVVGGGLIVLAASWQALVIAERPRPRYRHGR